MYRFYEKAVKAGITTICIHKGLLPKDYEKSVANFWQYATVDDVPKAAKDWPQLNFVIYQAAKQAFLVPPDDELAEFEKTGYIRWVLAQSGCSCGRWGRANLHFAAILEIDGRGEHNPFALLDTVADLDLRTEVANFGDLPAVHDTVLDHQHMEAVAVEDDRPRRHDQ